jgi:hypothetical protein
MGPRVTELSLPQHTDGLQLNAAFSLRFHGNALEVVILVRSFSSLAFLLTTFSVALEVAFILPVSTSVAYISNSWQFLFLHLPAFYLFLRPSSVCFLFCMVAFYFFCSLLLYCIFLRSVCASCTCVLNTATGCRPTCS